MSTVLIDVWLVFQFTQIQLTLDLPYILWRLSEMLVHLLWYYTLHDSHWRALGFQVTLLEQMPHGNLTGPELASTSLHCTINMYINIDDCLQLIFLSYKKLFLVRTANEHWKLINHSSLENSLHCFHGKMSKHLYFVGFNSKSGIITKNATKKRNVKIAFLKSNLSLFACLKFISQSDFCLLGVMWCAEDKLQICGCMGYGCFTNFRIMGIFSTLMKSKQNHNVPGMLSSHSRG